MIPLLTLSEVAKELQISVKAVQRLARTDQLKIYRLGLQTTRVSRTDLDLYLRRRTTECPKKTLPWHRRGADRLDPRPIYIAGYPFWQVELGNSGNQRRVRRTFADFEEARAFAEREKSKRSSLGRERLKMCTTC
jgi:excisionase family DNA binding protein